MALTAWLELIRQILVMLASGRQSYPQDYYISHDSWGGGGGVTQSTVFVVVQRFPNLFIDWYNLIGFLLTLVPTLLHSLREPEQTLYGG